MIRRTELVPFAVNGTSSVLLLRIVKRGFKRIEMPPNRESQLHPSNTEQERNITMSRTIARQLSTTCAITIMWLFVTSSFGQDVAVGIATEAEAAKSVRPGINERFLDPNLNLDEWVERFEGESREVFAARGKVLEAVGIKPGMQVADIGAGTGLYSQLFARAVGSKGWVFAVEISPRFVQHIVEAAQRTGLNNITSVLCDEDSINLPPESVDVAFICDVYHHFEYPKSTVGSIWRALRPGGKLVLIDFERIPGESRQWLLDHVRAGKETFQEEIESVGFEMVEEVSIDGFSENYFLAFQKND